MVLASGTVWVKAFSNRGWSKSVRASNASYSALLTASAISAPLIALAEWKVQAWPADKLPPHLRNKPAVKPDGKWLAGGGVKPL